MVGAAKDGLLPEKRVPWGRPRKRAAERACRALQLPQTASSPGTTLAEWTVVGTPIGVIAGLGAVVFYAMTPGDQPAGREEGLPV